MAEIFYFSTIKKSFSHKKFHRKDKMTGRVDIVCRIFEMISKKLKLTGHKKNNFESFQLNLTKWRFTIPWPHFELFLHFSKKCVSVSTIPVILSFMKICVARTSQRRCCRGSPGGWITFFLQKLGWLLYKWRWYFWTMEKERKIKL